MYLEHCKLILKEKGKIEAESVKIEKINVELLNLNGILKIKLIKQFILLKVKNEIINANGICF